MYAFNKTFYCLPALLCGAIAAADARAEPFLDGEYGMTSTQSCVRTPFLPPPAKGFDPSTLALLQQGEAVSAIGSGVMRFARDGAAEIVDGRFTEILSDRTQPGETPVNPLTEFGCTGDYRLDEGGAITVDLVCTVKPPAPGVAVTIHPFKFEGYVSRGKSSLQLNLIDGVVQTVAVSVNGQVVQQRERICVQNASLSRI